jgi:hypothetical protein
MGGLQNAKEEMLKQLSLNDYFDPMNHRIPASAGKLSF